MRFDPKTDHVVTAWAEGAGGPGWSNSPVLVLIKSALDGSYRVECMQPNEHSRDMYVLYGISEQASSAMRKAVEQELLDSSPVVVKPKRKRRKR